MNPEAQRLTNGHDRDRSMATYSPQERRPLSELFRELADEGSDLVREEVALAKAEMNEKLESYRAASMEMAVGGALLMASVLTLMWAVNRGLTALLTLWMDLDVAVWLSPLILTVVVASIGLALLGAGRRKIRAEGLTPERTRATMQENARWVKEKAREFKGGE